MAEDENIAQTAYTSLRSMISELKEVLRELYIELGKESKLSVGFVNTQLEKLNGGGD